MRIAVWHNLPPGGAKRALYDHVQGLIARGHSVEAWCPTTVNQSSMSLGPLVVEHHLPLQWQPSRHTATDKIRRLVLRDALATEMLRAVEEHCRLCAAQINQGKFDVVYSAICAYTAVSPIARYVNTPAVLYLQEPRRMLFEAPDYPWPALPPLSQGIRKPGYLKKLVADYADFQGYRIQMREEIENAKFYKQILVNSYFSRESVLRAYGLDASVCYLGVDTEKFHYQALDREGFIVGVGVLAPVKNVKLIIEALGCVSLPRPSLIWIANRLDREYLQAMKQLALELDVDFQLKVDISDEELVSILNRAALAAYAPRLEPFGYVPLEANACHLPVVAIAEGGLRETVTDKLNGLLVQPNMQALAQAIEYLWQDKAYARQLGDNASQYVLEKWSLGSAIDRLEAELVLAS